jgi:hypothetical protein
MDLYIIILDTFESPVSLRVTDFSTTRWSTPFIIMKIGSSLNFSTLYR